MIVVGVNDSPASRRAVEAGAIEAAMRQCRLELVHAFNWIPKLSRTAALDPPRSREALITRAITDARSVAPGVLIDVRPLEGAAVTSLLRRSRTADLTVIGDGDLLQSVCMPPDAVTVQVAARAAGTVLVTRAASVPARPVVVGADGSAASGRALEFAFDAATGRQAKLVVIHIREQSDDDARAAAAVIQMVGQMQRKYGLRAELQIIEGDPEVVLRQASQRAGLVIVGARGDRPYAGLLGWVAQTMLHHSPAPVALVRALLPDRRPASTALPQPQRTEQADKRRPRHGRARVTTS
ncbi:universal stress protein [Actinoplanes sp. GCM10030250]|uniref:universal stress protein n=1 Tax=Actinoplanes sp. GCM10030250 TaxID=3273376 RepID=UPI00360C0ECC